MKRFFKTSLVILLCIILCTSVVLASQKSDLENQKEDVNNQINDKKVEIEDVKKEISGTLAEVQEVTSKIESCEDEISDLENQIDDLEDTIVETEKRLKEAEEDYEEKQELLDARLVAIYEAGEVSYLDVLLGSGSITELISNYYLVQQLAECDTEVLNQIEKEKKEIEEAKTKLEESKRAIQEAKTKRETKALELKTQKAEKNKKVSQLNDEQKELQAELEQFEKDKKDIENQLAEIARKEQENNSGKDNIVDTPSKSGYISPIAGLTKANITCGYYGYSGHTGVDFSGGLYGRDVRAVKDGTVVTSTTKYGSIPNYGSNGSYVGSFASYGEYIIINHHDGTMTLYAHGKPGSRRVYEGQEVKQGQTIMQVGNTGNVLPRPTPGDPLRGTHLHFEVRVNGRVVNPTPYLP